MLNKLSALLALILIATHLDASAQSKGGDEVVDADKKFEEALRAKMKKDRELIENFMNDDLFKKFDKMFEQMTKDIDEGHFESLQKFFEQGHFNNFLGDSGLFDNLGLGQGKWIENREERILVLKINKKDEEPLNIEIKDSKVTVSGEVSTTMKNPLAGANAPEITTKRKINQSYIIPGDVDATKPKFENKDGSLFIRFTKLGAAPKATPPTDRQPIKPSDGDITI